MLKIFTDMATMRALLEAAEREAAAMGETEPGAEHVVLAALAMPDGTAAGAMAELGVDAARLRQAVDDVHAEALSVVGIADPPTPTPIQTPTGRGVYRSKGSTRDLLTATAEARKALRTKRFTSAHVLMGASTMAHGTLSQALARLDVDPETLRSTAERYAGPDGAVQRPGRPDR